MELTLVDGEPAAGPWAVVSMGQIVARLLSRVAERAAIPVVAMDGRNGSGMSTAALRLAAAIPDAAVLHAADVAWHHSYFDWTGLLRDGVLDDSWLTVAEHIGCRCYPARSTSSNPR